MLGDSTPKRIAPTTWVKVEIRKGENMSNEKIISLQLHKEHVIIESKEFQSLCRKQKEFEASLIEAYENNLISLDEVREKKKMMKKSLEKSVLTLHNAPIHQGKGKDKRWFTTIKTKGGKRNIIKKPTYEEVLEALVEFYGIGKEKYTLRNLYPIWVKNMFAQGGSPNYIYRIDADWRKYYEHDDIVDKAIEQLTINTIRTWLATQITTHHMKSKEFYNMQTIFKQIYKYAYEEELIIRNPFDKISFPKKQYFKGETSKIKRMEKTQREVFKENEIQKIKAIAMQDYLENRNYTTATAALGVLLLFQTGLRVGELVALREENIHEDHIYIECEEQRDYAISIDEKTNEVKCTYMGTKVGSAKTDASYRSVLLTSEAKKIIEMVRKANEENGFHVEDYLFVNAHQRMQENTILKRLYKFCDMANIERRSPHKIRKTFASVLVNSGTMDISEVASLLGHVDEKTLISHYLYSTKDEHTRLARMEECLAI